MTSVVDELFPQISVNEHVQDEEEGTQSWPPSNTEPTAKSPFFCDGGYGPEVLRVSPEGYIYGQFQWAHDVKHKIWWNGSKYRYVESTALWTSKDQLPISGSNLFHGRIDKVWEVVGGERKLREYWYDAENNAWKLLKWLWEIRGIPNIPYPGVQTGCAHVVIEEHVLHFWDGYQLRRPVHSMLENDELERHLPAGFQHASTAEVEVIFKTTQKIALEATEGGGGQIWINGQWVKATKESYVLNIDAIIDWDGAKEGLVFSYPEPSREYWIYLANSQSDEFFLSGLPGDETHAAIPATDFRGRLFLSRTSNVNGYLAASGAGANARIVGQAELDERGWFVNEIGMSWVNRATNFPETYRS